MAKGQFPKGELSGLAYNDGRATAQRTSGFNLGTCA